MNCLVFEDGEQYNPFNKEEPNWNTSYGDANDVKIEMLSLICFQNIKELNI